MFSLFFVSLRMARRSAARLAMKHHAPTSMARPAMTAARSPIDAEARTSRRESCAARGAAVHWTNDFMAISVVQQVQEEFAGNLQLSL
jgi:hypothetical protein